MEINFDNVGEFAEFMDLMEKVREPKIITKTVHETGGRRYGYDNEDLAVMIAKINTHSDKIQAIKLFREVTGLGLKESKEAIDRHWVYRKTI